MVLIYSRAYVKERVGKSRSTGKIVAVPLLVLEADVVSRYIPEDFEKVTATGNIFKNAEVAREFAEKIKYVVKNNLGSKIPSKEALRRIRRDEIDRDGVDLDDWWRYQKARRKKK